MPDDEGAGNRAEALPSNDPTPTSWIRPPDSLPQEDAVSSPRVTAPSRMERKPKEPKGWVAAGGTDV